MKKAILIIITLLTLCSCKEGPSNRMSRQDLRDKLAYRTASGLATNESGESVTGQHAGGSADEINYAKGVYNYGRFLQRQGICRPDTDQSK